MDDDSSGRTRPVDQKLNYKAHIARASQKGVNAALALKRLKNLRPETARRLFQAKIVPVVDYTSPICSPGLSISLINKLNVAQKIGGQAVTGAFRKVAGIAVRHHKQLKPLFYFTLLQSKKRTHRYLHQTPNSRS